MSNPEGEAFTKKEIIGGVENRGKSAAEREREIRDLLEDSNVLEILVYTEDQSPDFDGILKIKDCIYAPQKNFSARTKTKVLVSQWQVPCHVIVTRNPDGECQAIHVQPNQMSLLTYEQERELKKSGKQHASSIALKGRRAWFAPTDEQELQEFGMSHQRTINVDTVNWWRVLYDPVTNEFWVDVKEKRMLIKYKGFSESPAGQQ